MRINLLIIMLSVVACNNVKNVKSETSNQSIDSLINISRESIFTLRFDDDLTIDTASMTVQKSIASNVILGNASSNTKHHNGIMITAVQNSGNNITSKAKIKFSNSMFFENKKWFSFNFLIPENNIREEKNQERELIVFQIKHKFSDQNFLTVQYSEVNSTPILGLRFGRLKQLICVRKIKKGVWNNLILGVNFENNKYGYIQSWLNEESFTPETGFTNKFYGGTDLPHKQLELLLGQQRNWADSNPSIIYFDDFLIGENINDISKMKLPKETNSYLDVYK